MDFPDAVDASRMGTLLGKIESTCSSYVHLK